MKKVAVLGSTGSIGTSTLQIIKHFPEQFSVKVLAAHRNLELLSEQILDFHPELVAVYDEEKATELKKRFPFQKIVSGPEGLEEAASHPSVDFVVMAIVGSRALQPTLRAINAGKTVGIASKEVLVAAGELVMRKAHENQVDLIPIDSEHSAIFQCIEGRKIGEIGRIILTASGGPFRLWDQKRLASITVEEALAHPTWNMGEKITIDCSTLINKGLEMIEARWLFDIPPEKIDVVIHPQSIVHSLVEFIDGSLLAQLSEPSMVYPILYALTHPRRKPGLFPPFDFTKHEKLEFFAPDHQKFPALSLVKEALQSGGSAPCYLNGANEILVDRFLRKEISWLEILSKLTHLLERHHVINLDSIEAVVEIDKEARREALSA